MGREPRQNRAGDAEGKPRQNLTREKKRYHQLSNADSKTVCRQIFSEKNWGTAGAGTRPERGGIKKWENIISTLKYPPKAGENPK